MAKFTEADVGKKVVLPEDKEEGWKEEIGKLLEVAGDMIIVQVDPQYLDGEGDDGFRECSADGPFLLEEREKMQDYFDQVTSLHSEYPKK